MATKMKPNHEQDLAFQDTSAPEPATVDPRIGTIVDKYRIVRLLGQDVEIVPEGVLLVLNNKDKPGMVGYLGTLLARHNVNIASMCLSRDEVGGQALTVLNLDSVPPAPVLDELQKDSDISNVRVVKL